MKPPIRTHLNAALRYSLVMLVIYIAVQQTYHTAANAPQLQPACNTAVNIRHNCPCYPPTCRRMNTQRSLATFARLYDHRGRLISGGTTGSKAPRIPTGVLQNAQHHNLESIVTWHPEASVWLIARAKYNDSQEWAFKASAHSAQEAENDNARLTSMILLCWAAGYAM